MSRRSELSALVRAAAAGDPAAWDAIVVRMAPLVRSVARRHRLSPCDQDDIEQRTWLALLRHIERLASPEALPSWLVTTARNECLASLRAQRREVPLADLESCAHTPALGAGDARSDDAVELERAARSAAFKRAMGRSGARERAMLELLVAEPSPSYAEISARLDMPVGSIGPTRARSIARLRRDPYIACLLDESVRPARPTRPPRAHGDDAL